MGRHVAGHNAENVSTDLLRAAPADISPLRSAATPIHTDLQPANKILQYVYQVVRP